MEKDDDADKKDDKEAFAVDTNKTYKGILARKEAALATEAQFERRALALTKHFLKSHEVKESHRLDHLHEESKRHFDRSMAKVRQGFDSDAMLKEMVREEKSQISQLMAERLRQRQLEEDKKKEAKAEREYYMQARIIYNQLQAEERHKRVEEMQRERADAIKERMHRHHDRQKELDQEKNVARATTEAKFEESLDKVMLRKKETDTRARKDRHEKMSARAERDKKASEEVQRQVQKKKAGFKEIEEDRERRVAEQRKVEMQNLSSMAQRLVDRGLAPGSSRSAESSQPVYQPRAHEARVAGRNAGESHGAASTEKATGEPAKEEEKRSVRQHGSPPLKFHSKELIDANAQVHKDYMMRCKELNDASQSMNVQKKYKALADGAVEKADDYRSARLKSVHQTHMASKPKEPKKDSPISTRGSQRPTPRAAPRALTCGLCDREFPADHLVGSALRRTIEKMRNQSPNNRKSPNESKRKTQETPNEDAAGFRQSTVAAGGLNSPSTPHSSPSSPKKAGLYDYEVKLCVNCDIFTRIAST